MKKTQSSFGKYFDAQYERLREMLSNKDRKLHKEWEEDYNKRKKFPNELHGPGPDEEK